MRAVARENPRLSGVIDVTDFNATAAGQRIVDDQHLQNLVQVLNNPAYRLGLDDVEPDILQFARGQHQVYLTWAYGGMLCLMLYESHIDMKAGVAYNALTSFGGCLCYDVFTS